MKILLLGATGGLGKEILLYAIKNKINSLPVLDDKRKIIGAINIHILI